MRVELKDVTFSYGRSARPALSGVSALFESGSVTALMGESGSGKSTLLGLLNGLRRPLSGSVLIDGEDIWKKGYDRRLLPGKVGVVFQNPEDQLFERTVLSDTAYGPMNLGAGHREAEKMARAALGATGIGKELFYRSPFSLSGGEKRRVAISGIVAMESEVLVLDEVTAGLDRENRERVLSLIPLWKEKGGTVIFATHSVDEAVHYADTVILLSEGRVAARGKPEELVEKGLLPPPEAEKAAAFFRGRGVALPFPILSLEALVDALGKAGMA